MGLWHVGRGGCRSGLGSDQVVISIINMQCCAHNIFVAFYTMLYK